MKKVLVPLNIHTSAAQMQNAVAEAIAIYRAQPVQVHLLSVQAPVSRHVSGFFASGELRQIHLESGMEELAPARSALDAAGVPYEVHVHVGRSAETIVRVAQELGCDRILMGRTDETGFAEKLFGTVANQVRQLLGVTGNCQVIGS